MKKSVCKKPAALLLLAALLLGVLSGCGKSQGGYKILETLREEEYAIACRKGDVAGQYIQAAISVLAARGVTHELALKYFGADETQFTADEKALDEFKDIPTRTLIMGLDAGAYPMSYQDGESYAGFDVELAQRVCEELDWVLQFQPIDEAEAITELNAGNVDVAWGGMSFDAESTGKTLDVGPSYLSNSVLLVVKKGDGRRALKGQPLGVPENGAAKAVVKANEKLMGTVQKLLLLPGTQECFAALDAGKCAGIVVDSVAFQAKTS